MSKDPVIKALFDLVNKHWPIDLEPEQPATDESQQSNIPAEPSNPPPSEPVEPVEEDADAASFNAGEIAKDVGQSGLDAELASALGMTVRALPVEPVSDSQVPEDSLGYLMSDWGDEPGSPLPENHQLEEQSHSQPVCDPVDGSQPVPADYGQPASQPEHHVPFDSKSSLVGSPSIAPTVLEDSPTPPKPSGADACIEISDSFDDGNSDPEVAAIDRQIAELKRILGFF